MPDRLLTLLFAALFFLLYSNPLQSQSVESWTPESMVNLPVAGSPEISPDGSMVAYTVRETNMEGEESSFLTHMWIAKTDGSMNRQFTRGDESATNPQFSPMENIFHSFQPVTVTARCTK